MLQTTACNLEDILRLIRVFCVYFTGFITVSKCGVVEHLHCKKKLHIILKADEIYFKVSRGWCERMIHDHVTAAFWRRWT